MVKRAFVKSATEAMLLRDADSRDSIERYLSLNPGLSFVANDIINAQQFYESLGWFPRDEVRMYSFNASENQNI